VIAVGKEVTGIAPGAHIIGTAIKGGAFAEFTVLPAAAALSVPQGGPMNRRSVWP